MMYRLFRILGIGLIIVSCACIHAAPPEPAFLVIDGADDVRKYKADDGGRLQIDYSVSVEYPELAIGEPQWEKLKKRGWSRCAVKAPGWNIFPDIATGDGRTVHRHTSYWAKDNRLITISLNYYSALQERSRNIKPDNSTQRVVILFDSYDDIRVIEDRLEISCP
jgi:hypothetical protein